ncbi:hypothetical protein ACFQ3N_05160 [Virgibacillus byunsanensis]|uniref:Uncharacterized protein n=1 Tax=Virgibacillus byunsanensis TaxID=570945 RepID=A0ABW3LIX7_9BACI
MPLWIFILIVFGGLLLMGVVVDVIAKRKGKKLNLEKEKKDSSTSERVYGESFKHEIKQNMHRNHF